MKIDSDSKVYPDRYCPTWGVRLIGWRKKLNSLGILPSRWLKHEKYRLVYYVTGPFSNDGYYICSYENYERFIKTGSITGNAAD